MFFTSCNVHIHLTCEHDEHDDDDDDDDDGDDGDGDDDVTATGGEGVTDGR